MAYLEVQVSNKKKIASDERWFTIPDIKDVEFQSEMGLPRTVIFTVANPDNALTSTANLSGITQFENYLRIRCFSRRFDIPIFLGRIVNIIPSHRGGSIRLVAADYLHDLSTRTNSAVFYGGSRRSDIIKQIITGGDATRRGVFGAGTWQQSIRHDIHVEDSSFIQYMRRHYGSDDGESGMGDGYEALLTSIEALSKEDPWQDLQVLRETEIVEFPGTPSQTTVTKYELHTENALSGESLIPLPPSNKYIYIGSTKEFQNIHFVPVNYKDAEGYTLEFEYSDGFGGWSRTFPSGESLNTGETITDEINLSLEPSLLSFNIAWIGADVVFPGTDALATDTVITYDNENRTGRTEAIPTTFSADNSLFVNRYWLRIGADAFGDDRGISTIILSSLNDGHSAKWDYRAEDPHFFDKVLSGDDDVSEESWGPEVIPNPTTGYIYMGSTYPFMGFDYELRASMESTTDASSVEYYGESGWTSTTLESDFQEGGRRGMVVWDIPDDWRLRRYDGSTLYWARIAVNENTEKLMRLRTASIASFKYFERGTEPWPYGGGGESYDRASKFLGRKVENLWNINENDRLVPLRLRWRGNVTDNELPILDYDVNSNELDIVTRVVVHGRGVRGFSINSTIEDELHIIKEKVFHLYELDTVAECNNYAQLLLHQYQPKNLEGFRHGHIELHEYPSYKPPNRPPVAVREGDIIRVSIRDGTFDGDEELIDEPFMVLGIVFKEEKSKFVVQVSRDLVPTPKDSNSIEKVLDSLGLRERIVTWKQDVPVEESASTVTLHSEQGQYTPMSRERVIRVGDTITEEDIYVRETYTGLGNNPANEGNWNTDTAQKDNAIIITGKDFSNDEEKNPLDNVINSDEFADSGVITHDGQEGVLKARIPMGEPTDSVVLRDIAVGEWGQIEASSSEMEIIFKAPYSTPPAVVSSVDASGASLDAGTMVSIHVSEYMSDMDNYTGVRVKVASQSISGSGSHTHDIPDSTLVTSTVTQTIDTSVVESEVAIPTLETQLNIRTSKPSLVFDGDDADSTTYMVSLSASPSDGDSVRVTLSNFGTDVITVEPIVLDFTNADGQTVTVTPVEDADDLSDLTAIRHRLTYPSDNTNDYVASDVNLSVFVTETPDILTQTPVSGGIIVNPTSLSLTEAGSSSDYDIRLSVRPNEGSTVRVFIDNPSDAIIISRTVLFFDDSNWNNNQEVTVRAVPDVDVTDETVRLRHTIISDGYDAPERILTVSVTDAGEVITPSMDVDGSILLNRSGTVEVNENSFFDYTVSLNPAPNAGDTVIVEIRVSDSSVATVNNSTLSFTSTSSQTVRVTGSGDTDTNTETTSIIHSISDGDYNANAEFFNVRVIDTDVVPIDPVGGTIVLNRSTSVTHEVDEGSFIDYTVRLGARPNEGDDITVNLSGYDSSVISLDTTSLTFADDDWNDEQTVRVTGRSDTDTNNETTSIMHSISEAGYTAASRVLNIRVIDTTVIGISGSLVFSTTDITIAEPESGITTTSYTVGLSSPPSTPVTIRARRRQTGAHILNFGNFGTTEFVDLNFPANFSGTRTVTLRATGDTDADDDFFEIDHSVQSGTYTLSGNTVVFVTVSDSDFPPVFGSIILSDYNITMNEETSTTYTVHLSDSPNPGFTVRVRIFAISGGDEIIDSISASGFVDNTAVSYPNGHITFDTGNWDSPRTITIVARDVPGNDFDILNHSVEGIGYNAQDEVLNINVIDTIDGTITLESETDTGSNLEILEGDTESYRVSLVSSTGPPLNNVRINVTVLDNAPIRISRSSSNPNSTSLQLTFTPSNSTMKQRIYVRSLSNSVTFSTFYDIRHSVDSSSTYDAYSENLLVRVLNEVTGSIRILAPFNTTSDLELDPNTTPISADIDEGHIETYSVDLLAIPNAGDTVEVTAEVINTSIAQIRGYTGSYYSDPDSGFGRTVTMTYTTGNWSNSTTSGHRIDVRGIPRGSISDGTTIIRHTITMGGYIADAEDLDLTVKNTHRVGDLRIEQGNTLIARSGGSGTVSVNENAEITVNLSASTQPVPTIPQGGRLDIFPEVTNGQNIEINGESGSDFGVGSGFSNWVFGSGSTSWNTGSNIIIRGVSTGTSSIRFYIKKYTLIHNEYIASNNSQEVTLNIAIGDAIVNVNGEIQVNRGQNVVVREGGTMTYDVNLSEPPNDEVTVGLVRFLNDPSIGIESPTGQSTSLVFPAGSDVSVTRSVTIYGVSDNIVQANSAIVAHGITSGSYNADPLGVRVYVSDDEATPTSGAYQFQQSGVQTVGVGETINIRVRLTVAPTTVIVLRPLFIRPGDNEFDQVSIRPEDGWLAFTPGNYNTYQTIEVTGVSDSGSARSSGVVWIVAPATGVVTTSNDASLYDLTNLFTILDIDVIP